MPQKTLVISLFACIATCLYVIPAPASSVEFTESQLGLIAEKRQAIEEALNQAVVDGKITGAELRIVSQKIKDYRDILVFYDTGAEAEGADVQLCAKITNIYRRYGSDDNHQSIRMFFYDRSGKDVVVTENISPFATFICGLLSIALFVLAVTKNEPGLLIASGIFAVIAILALSVFLANLPLPL